MRELRITPTTTSGVVTYQAVIDVANPQSRLRPGMTATVTAVTSHHPGVLRVPNAALRYRPSSVAGADAGTDTGAAPSSARAWGDAGRGGDGGVASGRGGGRGSRGGAGDRGGVYVLRGASAVRVPVRVGLTDGIYTEVTAAELSEGALVVVDETDATGAEARRAGPAPRGRGLRGCSDGGCYGGGRGRGGAGALAAGHREAVRLRGGLGAGAGGRVARCPEGAVR